MLFSATMPDDIIRIATEYMTMPFRVEIVNPGIIPERVEQELFVLKKEEKISLLEKLLLEYRRSVLVFCRTKYGARKICHAIRTMGHTAADIHSGRPLSQRRDALAGFKSGKYRILVATDIASRGIDVTGIELVINFDIPENPSDYIHRIGRTARAGALGHAISFVTPEQKRAVREIERLLKTFIAVSKLPELPSRLQEKYNDYGVHHRSNYDRRKGGRKSSRPVFGAASRKTWA